MGQQEVLLNSRQVAHILDCSPDEVHALVRRGLLKASKVGRLWKYRYEDVMAYKGEQDKDD